MFICSARMVCVAMMQAIEAVYPKSCLQRCIVYQIRSSIKYVSYKDIKQVVADLKKVYTAVTLEEAEANLETSGGSSILPV